jgi:uncharacterized membrane protein YdfJ with MMPL/SSD domain
MKAQTSNGSPVRATAFTGRIARWSAMHRWLVAGAALLVILIAGIVGMAIETDLLNSDGGEGEAAAGWRLVEEHFTFDSEPPEQLVFAHPSLQVDDPAYQAAVEATIAKLRALREVREVVSYYEIGDRTLVSADGHVLLAPVYLRGHVAHVLQVLDEVAPGSNEFTIAMAGWHSLEWEAVQVQDRDFSRVLMVTLVLGLVILTLAFRALVAAVIPLALALGAIFATMAVAAVISQAYPLHELYAEMVLLMGMAVGIDYSLFMVSRFRKERAAGRTELDAIIVASDTTGRSVFYAGVTVVLSLAGLILPNNDIFISLALGAVIVVMIAVLGSLTLLPALLAILGDNVDRLRLPFLWLGNDEGSIWGRVTDRVLARPTMFSVVTLGALIALAAPVTALNLGFSTGAAAYPDAIKGKQALRLLEEHFAVGMTQPAIVVITADDVTAPPVMDATQRLMDAASHEPLFMGSFQHMVSRDRRVAMVRLPINADPDDKRAEDAVLLLRKHLVAAAFTGNEASVYVSGSIAGSMDFAARMYGVAPYVFGFVLGLAFLLLLVMFRSIVIPLKAIALNLLSVAAAYGVLVLVFQYGLGQSLLGFEATGRVAPWLPLFLFTILFGLSMDYHMLLLGRIKEAHDAGYSNEESVSIGIRATAATITSAAAIMVGVFGSFALASTLELKQFGIGLGVSVFLDATVIRIVLLPASMKLLGELNWYMPSWLEWLPGLSHVENPDVAGGGSFVAVPVGGTD